MILDFARDVGAALGASLLSFAFFAEVEDEVLYFCVVHSSNKTLKKGAICSRSATNANLNFRPTELSGLA